jgi:ribonuclease HII
MHEHFYLIGVDEAGRGPLCGPVVAGAVLLRPGQELQGMACSKTLSATQRVRLQARIQAEAMAWATASASVEEIDRLNILQASLLAMHRAVDAVCAQAQQQGVGLDQLWVLVDGNRCPLWSYASQCVVKGDTKVPAISAASILAKVARDAWCAKQALLYPQYELDVHKGYPTPRHLELLHQHGPCVLHRRSFKPVAALLHALDNA